MILNADKVLGVALLQVIARLIARTPTPLQARPTGPPKEPFKTTAPHGERSHPGQPGPHAPARSRAGLAARAGVAVARR